MTELQKSYSIEKNHNLAETLPQTVLTQGAAVEKISDGDDPSIPSVVSYPPRINSKLILQNMEEVLHTVKKQHKEKHRRKKELKKLAMTGSAAGECSSVTPGSHSDVQEIASKSDKPKHRDKEKRQGKKHPLREKTAEENGKVLQESPRKAGTILHHFQRTPKKDSQMSSDSDEKADVDVKPLADGENDEKVKTTPLKSHKVTNAFEVMMNARNKTIGSNTPGKESPSPGGEREARDIREKRKSKLQEWADQKGGAKRKLEDDERGQYVEEQLEQRAKRFKKMLVNGASPKSTEVPSKQKTTKHKRNNQKATVISQTKSERTKDTEKKRRSKTRVKRLISLDSIESIEIPSPSMDKETEEFISKLNSPTKKRDSLLGYFPKKELTKNVAVEEVIEVIKLDFVSPAKADTSHRKGKKSDLHESVGHATTESNISLDKQKENTSEVGGRPRRSCAGKTRYDFHRDDSPTKEEKLSRGTPARKATKSKNESPMAKPKMEEVVDDVIIVLDDSNVSAIIDIKSPQETPKKLAPLFVRSVPKPTPDPEVLKARRAFLQSGVPEILRLEQEKQRLFDQTYEESTDIFPKIAHVRQLSGEEVAFDCEAVRISFKLQRDETSLGISSPTARRGKGRPSKQTVQIVCLSDCTLSDFQPQRRLKATFAINEALLPSLANKRCVIKNWKTEFERFPTFKCYNQMREKYRFFNAIDSAQDTEQVTESFVVTRRTRRSLGLQLQSNEHDNQDEEYKPPATAPNGELLFSEKYKPLLFEQVLVNLSPVTQLKEFLSSWSTNSRGAGSGKSSQNYDEDSVDFNDSASQGPACNTVVLLGPVSSGKTNAVFALANEMNFNVLEINAGMKRTGKKLIQELQEATQSHQIRKDAAGPGSSQKNNLLKMSLNGLKSKVHRQNSNSNNLDSAGSDSSNGDSTPSDRKCLILIEDADIVFDQTDAGFTDAIYTLAASSKRPVIVVATNPNCAHLQRLMAQNTIHFPPQNVLGISKFLSVLSLMENCPVMLDDIISLYLYNKRDLRKTLLELQFFIQSGGDREKQIIAAKESSPQTAKDNTYFASPRKRQFSTEQNQADNQDNILTSETKNSTDKSSDMVYMHRSLFEFFTVCQNSKFRVPFPTDFQKFRLNLNDVFKVSRKLNEDSSVNQAEKTFNNNTKRKSKSPKKPWHTNRLKSTEQPLDNLCAFYEDVSVAALMDREDLDSCRLTCSNKLNCKDRIKTDISEFISHTLLESTIAVNLDAEACPYNLFETPKVIPSLCNVLGSMQMRSKRSRCLDYEANLRSICRSEKIRASLERRSTRFYHYLRTYSSNVSNFSSAHFDEACQVFQSFGEDVETTTTPPPI